MYSYDEEKKALFTEDGQRKFLAVRDRVQQLIAAAGAFRETHLSISGDSFFTMACLDRLVELGELTRLRSQESCWRQFQVYAPPQTMNW